MAETDTEQERSGRASLRSVAAVGTLVVAVNALIGLIALEIGTRDFLGIDDYLRVTRLRDVLDGRNSWFDGSLHWSNTPFGAGMHWSRAIELVVLVASAPLAPFLGWREATYWGGLSSALVLALALAAAVYWTARALLPQRAALLAAAVAAVQPAVLGFGRMGHVDHHIALAACVMAMLGAALRLVGASAEHRVHAVVGGLVAAVGVWVSPEALIGAIALVAVVGIDWLARGSAVSIRHLVVLTGTWTVTSLLLSASDHGLCDALVIEYDRLSAPHIVLAAACFLGALLLFAVPGDRAGRRPLRFGAAAVATGTGLLFMRLCTIDPGTILTAPASVMPPDLIDEWLYRLPEFDGVTDVGLAAVAYFTWPVVGLVVALRRVRRRTAVRRAQWATIAAWIGLTLVLGLWAVRLAIYAQTASAICIAAATWPLLSHLRRVQVGTGLALRRAAVVTAALLGYTIPAMMVAIVVRPTAEDGNVQCATNALAEAMDSRTTDGDTPSILTHLDMSMIIHYRNGAEVVATGHHRNVDGMRAVRATLQATPEVARTEIERRGVDFIAVCDALDDTFIEPAPADSLFRRLADGRPPEWLVEVPLQGGDSRLYEVPRSP